MKTKLDTQEVEVRPPGESDARRDLAPDIVHLICGIQRDLTPGNPVRKSALVPTPQAHSLPLLLSRTQSNLVVLNPTVFFSPSGPVAPSRTQSNHSPFQLSTFPQSRPQEVNGGQWSLTRKNKTVASPPDDPDLPCAFFRYVSAIHPKDWQKPEVVAQQRPPVEGPEGHAHRNGAPEPCPSALSRLLTSLRDAHTCHRGSRGSRQASTPGCLLSSPRDEANRPQVGQTIPAPIGVLARRWRSCLMPFGVAIHAIRNTRLRRWAKQPALSSRDGSPNSGLDAGHRLALDRRLKPRQTALNERERA